VLSPGFLLPEDDSKCQTCYPYGMANPTAILETSEGEIVVELYGDKMPVTTGNFLSLAESGFYVGCPHSRDPESLQAGTGDSPNGTIADEHPEDAKLSNEPGTLSMANTGRPNSGSCQFFINTVHNDYLDWFSPGPSKHPVFGRVTSGMEVIEKIEKLPTNAQDRPVSPVQMIRIRVGD